MVEKSKQFISLLCVAVTWGCTRDQSPTSEAASDAHHPPTLDLKSRSIILSGLKPEEIQALPVWTADYQRRFERQRTARTALAKNEFLYLSQTEEARCLAHQKWQAAMKVEQDEFEKSRLSQSWQEVNRNCVAELAAVRVELPPYAVLKLQISVDATYDFAAKGFHVKVYPPEFDINRVLKLRPDVVVTLREGLSNIYRCEIGDGGALYLYHALAIPDGTGYPNPIEPPDHGLRGFIHVIDETKAKSLSKRLKQDDMGRSNASLDILFRPLPYGGTPYLCAPEFRGMALSPSNMEMWRGDPIGYRFSIDAQPTADWLAFEGLQQVPD